MKTTLLFREELRRQQIELTESTFYRAMLYYLIVWLVILLMVWVAIAIAMFSWDIILHPEW